MIHEIVKHILDPSKTDIKRAQMFRTLLQIIQVFATLAVVGFNVWFVLHGGK